eukprot:GFYU01011018.1.p1 GENE.GFYU01011018.1~~GFYU01011018.1.p1  ORF type:complete len:571 (-),score=107.30 GFYU01011018.1:897-2564(-)
MAGSSRRKKEAKPEEKERPAIVHWQSSVPTRVQTSSPRKRRPRHREVAQSTPDDSQKHPLAWSARYSRPQTNGGFRPRLPGTARPSVRGDPNEFHRPTYSSKYIGLTPNGLGILSHRRVIPGASGYRGQTAPAHAMDPGLGLTLPPQNGDYDVTLGQGIHTDRGDYGDAYENENLTPHLSEGQRDGSAVGAESQGADTPAADADNNNDNENDNGNDAAVDSVDGGPEVDGDGQGDGQGQGGEAEVPRESKPVHEVNWEEQAAEADQEIHQNDLQNVNDAFSTLTPRDEIESKVKEAYLSSLSHTINHTSKFSPRSKMDNTHTGVNFNGTDFVQSGFADAGSPQADVLYPHPELYDSWIVHAPPTVRPLTTGRRRTPRGGDTAASGDVSMQSSLGRTKRHTQSFTQSRTTTTVSNTATAASGYGTVPSSAIPYKNEASALADMPAEPVPYISHSGLTGWKLTKFQRRRNVKQTIEIVKNEIEEQYLDQDYMNPRGGYPYNPYRQDGPMESQVLSVGGINPPRKTNDDGELYLQYLRVKQTLIANIDSPTLPEDSHH